MLVIPRFQVVVVEFALSEDEMFFKKDGGVHREVVRKDGHESRKSFGKVVRSGDTDSNVDNCSNCGPQPSWYFDEPGMDSLECEGKGVTVWKISADDTQGKDNHDKSAESVKWC